MFESSVFRRYFLPGFVFQSLLIGGGYGTGRELVEFFLSYGPLGGLLGMLVSTGIWCAVCGLTYELSRAARTYDYRSFSRQLLGRGWVLFEICYLFISFIALAVIAAASGSILQETFGVPYFLGVASMMTAVAFLIFKGSSTIEKYLALWSFVLYGVYLLVCIQSFWQFGPEISATLASAEMKPGWFIGGVRYAGYNLVAVPAILFCVRHIKQRSEALTAGLLTGPIGIIPGVFFYMAMAAHYPAITGETVPANYVLDALGSRAFQYSFQIILLGTLIETGTGLIHGFNERMARTYAERRLIMPQYLRPLLGLSLLILATLMSRFGLVDLIAKGYGTSTWGVLLVYVVPVLTLGLWKVIKAARAGAPAPAQDRAREN